MDCRDGIGVVGFLGEPEGEGMLWWDSGDEGKVVIRDARNFLRVRLLVYMPPQAGVIGL